MGPRIYIKHAGGINPSLGVQLNQLSVFSYQNSQDYLMWEFGETEKFMEAYSLVKNAGLIQVGLIFVAC